MADPITELKKLGYPELPAPKQNIWNMASGGTDPVLDRAVIALQREYPGDITDVDIKPMPWSDPLATSSILGTTDIAPGQRNQTVRTNPVQSITFPQRSTESTLAHELQHVRQNRASNIPDSERYLAYEHRPSEKEATDIAKQFRKQHGYSDESRADQALFDAMPIELTPVERLARMFRGMPGVKVSVEPDR